MILNAPNLQYFFHTLDVRYGTAWDATPVWWNKVADMYPTTSSTEYMGATQMLNKMRQWTGSRVTHNIAPFTQPVNVQNFEATLLIDKFKLADDHFGIYYRFVSDLALQAKKLPDYQLRDMIFNIGAQTGAPQLCYDGLTGWNTAHPVNLYDTSYGTYSNDYRGTYSGLGGALAPNSLANVWEDMAARASENGEPFGVMPDLLVVPPALKYIAMTLLQGDFIATTAIGGYTTATGPTANVLKNFGVALEVIPEFNNYPTDWFLLDTKRGVKPFGWLSRQEPILVERISPTDPVAFDVHGLLYGLEARGAPFFGPPWLSSISSP